MVHSSNVYNLIGIEYEAYQERYDSKEQSDGPKPLPLFIFC